MCQLLLNFPGILTLDSIAMQPIHLSSYDLEKYSQQVFSVAGEFTDFFFFLISSAQYPGQKKARVKCHKIDFTGSVLI